MLVGATANHSCSVPVVRFHEKAAFVNRALIRAESKRLGIAPLGVCINKPNTRILTETGFIVSAHRLTNITLSTLIATL